MNQCPFKPGDSVIYLPSRRGYGLEDGDCLETGKTYKIESIKDGCYVIVEGYRHPGGGIFWTEFKMEKKS